MRDLVFKNLISSDRKKKIIATCEVADQNGIRSTIQRHFICIVKEVRDNKIERPLPYLYVLREHNNRCQCEKFFCRIKGSVYLVSHKRLFLLLYMHSLKIRLTPLPQDLANRNSA